MSVTIHPTAIVDEGATIGSGTRIWHWCHVCAGAEVGKSVILGQNVFIGSRAFVGDGCKIQNNVSVFDNVRLEKHVFCGPSVVFTNVINPRAFVERKAEFADTYVRQGATLGANSTIICGVEIGKYALIGAGSIVTKSVKAHALVVGVPAKQIGWVSKKGFRLSLPLRGDGEFFCEEEKETYTLQNGEVRLA